MRTLAVIGCGAIGRYVIEFIQKSRQLTLSGVITPDGKSRNITEHDNNRPVFAASLNELKVRPEVVIDCAGHNGLKMHGTDALRSGADLLTVSIGALADDELYQRLKTTAEKHKSQIHLASGAIGALDALSAAATGGLDRVVYRGRKPPAGWAGSAAEEALDLACLDTATCHFSGTARIAALKYPKNANVAASVALAGIGFDRTDVELIADPGIDKNIHEIEATGAFGSFSFKIHGRSLPDNPKSSALTAMSVVRRVLNFDTAIVQ